MEKVITKRLFKSYRPSCLCLKVTFTNENTACIYLLLPFIKGHKLSALTYYLQFILGTRITIPIAQYN